MNPGREPKVQVEPRREQREDPGVTDTVVGRRLAGRQLRRGAVAGLLIWTSLLGGCGEGTGPEAFIQVVVTPEVALLDSVGATLQFTGRILDGNGRLVPGSRVTWSSSDTAVAVVDAAGRAEAKATGTTTITAASDALTGQASLEVYAPEPVAYQVGEAHYGRRQYTEYLPGDLPILVSAPHGGYEEPDEIPDRTYGTMTQDRNTQEMARAVRAALFDHTGRYPHVIISRLHRRKLDPNREIGEAAQDNPFAEHAWREFHRFVEAATGTVTASAGRGLYLDLHGHGHEIQRLELGYLLTSSELALSDEALEALVAESSVRALALESSESFTQVIRGTNSLGGLLAARGYQAVPSPADPDPGGNPYFSGGYNTRRHGSRDGGTVSGIQIEMHYDGVRDTEANRETYAAALVFALDAYLRTHLILELPRAVQGMHAGR
jgi:hypothetical protein